MRQTEHSGKAPWKTSVWYPYIRESVYKRPLDTRIRIEGYHYIRVSVYKEVSLCRGIPIYIWVSIHIYITKYFYIYGGITIQGLNKSIPIQRYPFIEVPLYWVPLYALYKGNQYMGGSLNRSILINGYAHLGVSLIRGIPVQVYPYIEVPLYRSTPI